jgi:hypothetical protein
MIASRRRIAFACLVGFLMFSLQARAQPTIRKRVESLDARHWDFSKRLPLRGNWSFVENEIISPENIDQATLSIQFFPSLWNDYRLDGKGIGSATYILNVLVPDSITNWSLEIPPPFNAYAIWINGNLVASAGAVGVRKETTEPKWIYQVAPFQVASDTLQVVLQLANFHHHKGGATNPIYLGPSSVMTKHFAWSIGSNVFEVGFLFLEGVLFLFLYHHKKRKVILYFALLCLTWSIRSAFSNQYPVMLVFPEFSWSWLVKIEYITIYLTVIWAALFFNSLLEDISNVIFTYLPVGINVFFVAFTLLTPAITYTRWVTVYLGVASMVILYAVILIIRALIIDRNGSWFLMSSIWIGVLLFGYDIAAYQGSLSYNAFLMNLGYVMIFLFTTVALMYHLNIFKGRVVEKSVMTMDDIHQSNKKYRD